MKTLNNYILETKRLSSLDIYIIEKFKLSSTNINKQSSEFIVKELFKVFCGDNFENELKDNFKIIFNEYKKWIEEHHIYNMNDLDGLYFICKDNELLNEYKEAYKDKGYKFDNNVKDILNNLQIIASTFGNKFIITDNFIGHYIYDYKRENVYVGYKTI